MTRCRGGGGSQRPADEALPKTYIEGVVSGERARTRALEGTTRRGAHMRDGDRSMRKAKGAERSAFWFSTITGTPAGVSSTPHTAREI